MISVIDLKLICERIGRDEREKEGMEERKERGRGSSCYIQRGKRACSCEIACAKRCVEFLFSNTRSSRDVLGLRCAFDHPTTRIATEMMMNNVIRKNGREHLVANYLRIIPRRRYVTHTHTHTYTCIDAWRIWKRATRPFSLSSNRRSFADETYAQHANRIDAFLSSGAETKHTTRARETEDHDAPSRVYLT